MTAAPPALELENVSAAYSTYRALFGVSLTVPADGIVALVGSNGAGKSTLARVATGLVPVTSGTVRICGEDVSKLSAHRVARMGVTHVPEGRAVFASLTVEENLTVSFLKRTGRRGTAEALARAYDAFPVLAERRRQYGGTLSGGQQRILSLAKVLAVAPKLLVVDELSLGLAPVIVDQVYDGLVSIHRQGCALLVVEQQVDRALAIADTAVLLVKGSVAWQGPAAEAKPVLETQMLSGASANGSMPSMNGTTAHDASLPAPPAASASPAAPQRPAAPAQAAPPAAAPTATEIPIPIAAPPAQVPMPPAAPAPTAPAPAAPAPSPGVTAPPTVQKPPRPVPPGHGRSTTGRPPVASWRPGRFWSAGSAGPPAVTGQVPTPTPPSPEGPHDGNGHPADLWIVGPNFPVNPS